MTMLMMGYGYGVDQKMKKYFPGVYLCHKDMRHVEATSTTYHINHFWKPVIFGKRMSQTLFTNPCKKR